MKKIAWTVAIACVCLGGVAAPPPLAEEPFQENLRSLKSERSDAETLRRAKDFVARHPLSSLQVKAMAARLPDDTARLEFALAAYPQTVDPENFYEVYDAFKSFSKVMRLHDQIRGFERHPPIAVVERPQPVNPDELKDIVGSLRKESFDQTKSQLARQIVSGSRKPFLSAQIKQILDCFDFEPTKLDVAKFAYDYTLDQDKYFLVNDAFSFDNSKRELSRYVEAKAKERTPARK
jgi:hypothetical protein